ncbi:ATP-dependent DNA helicase DDX11 isoform X2 [Lasioglossum baleicum]|uniref:ATP-dependent DNA helicase DDX11 isoform X2 n=1 Tax=Lasioglossum baleicum TaxID=434251 RepID=UPI003FCC2F0B
MQSTEGFPFPFPPYTIQSQFMEELYKCLENGNLGIFESPTGTESLSNTSNNWLFVQTEQMRLSAKKHIIQRRLNSILQYECKKNSIKETVKSANNTKKLHEREKPGSSKQKEEIDLPLETEDVTQEEKIEEELVLEDVQNSDNSESEEDEEDAYENTKIFFCSRTHSQLSQFIGELKKSPYSKTVSVVTLASRQSYCINKNIRRLKQLNLMNEHCLQLQKKKTTMKDEKDLKRKKVMTSCPFLPGNQDLLIGETITQIQDVEEITEKGEAIKTCAYYASRKAIPHCQLILIPYNSVLHKNTRISSGIKLKGNVLIIDEAHNLLEAIERMHSVMISGRNILHCYSQLSQYQKRFQALFSAKSVLSLSHLSFYLKKLLTIFGATTKSNPSDVLNTEATSKLYKVEEFELMTEIDNVNIFELLKFIKNFRLTHKLQGFMEQYGDQLKIQDNRAKTSGVTQFLNTIKNKSSEDNATDAVPQEEQSNNPLISIVSFIECLQSDCSDGRILVVPGPTLGQNVIKFLLLNPAAYFHDIVRDAKAVVLAGGTMAPMDEFTEQLFVAAGASPERIVTFSCDHVVPQENITCSIVTCGPTGVEFEFNFQNRQNIKLLDELGRALVNICNIVPAGIVVFLPSYSFEELLYKHLDKSGIISKISLKKCVFREPKSTSQVNEILEQYARRIKHPQSPQNGSLLFSVVGGKLSEGLNFSDDLGRCVIVVGMPYPNIKSLELQEKMKYLNENVKSGAGQSFYENACMKAVNQCIGRAIRHINDYSTVVLFDKRYPQKTKALPHWIQRTVISLSKIIEHIMQRNKHRKNGGDIAANTFVYNEKAHMSLNYHLGHKCYCTIH